MKKYKNIYSRSIVFSAMLLVFMSLLLVNCKGTKEENNGMTDFEAAMTNEDSLAVVDLIDQFFVALENGEVNSAVAMLYKVDPRDMNGTPEVLDNEEMENLRTLFASIPVYEHKIDYIKFYNRILNEVKCTAILQPAHDNVPSATMSYYFKPINSMGTWVLCLMNSDSGNFTIVKNEDKDSLTEHYQEIVKMQQEQKEAEQKKEAEQQTTKE